MIPPGQPARRADRPRTASLQALHQEACRVRLG